MTGKRMSATKFFPITLSLLLRNSNIYLKKKFIQFEKCFLVESMTLETKTFFLNDFVKNIASNTKQVVGKLFS